MMSHMSDSAHAIGSDIGEDPAGTGSVRGRGGNSRSSYYSDRVMITREGVLDPALLARTEGFMHKKGGAVNARGGFRNWKKRWFVLAPVDFLGQQGYELQYYDSPYGSLKGRVGLSEVEIFSEERGGHTNKKVKHEFQIVLQNGGVLHLSCDDAAEREAWIDTLNIVSAYLRKIQISNSSMFAQIDGYDPLNEDNEQSYNTGEEIAQNCQAYGAALFGAEAGQRVQFIVQLYDSVGQQVTRGGMPITATLTDFNRPLHQQQQRQQKRRKKQQQPGDDEDDEESDEDDEATDEGDDTEADADVAVSDLLVAPCLYYVRMLDNEDGTYLGQYVLGRKGRYSLSILLNDEHHIFGSPFEVRVLPSKTAAACCTAHGLALESVCPGASSSFVITAADGFGNRKTRGGDPFEVAVLGPAQLKSLSDCGDGTYICEVEAFPQSATAAKSAAGGKRSSSNNLLQVSDEQHPTASSRLLPANSLQLKVTLYGKSIAGSPFKPTIDYSSSELATAADDAVESIARSSVQQLSLQHTSEDHNKQQAPVWQQQQQQQQLHQETAAETSTPLQSARKQKVHMAVGIKGNVAAVAESALTPAQSTGQMSRLERSRQRALMAKALAEGTDYPDSTATTAAAAAAVSSPQLQPPQPPTATSAVVAPLSARSDRGLNSSQKLSQVATRAASNLNAMRATSTPQRATASPAGDRLQSPISPRPVNKELLSAVAVGLKQGLGAASDSNAGNSNDDNNDAAAAGPPRSATASEIKIWDTTHRAFSNLEVLKLLCSHLDVLKQLFDLFCSSVEGVQVIKFSTSERHKGGVFRLLELYDVVPAYLSKMEVKVMFALVAHAQRNLKSAASVAGGGSGLDFVSFLKLLVMLAHHSLSKTSAYSNMYSTIESKIEVMLFKWAIADAAKLQAVRSTIQ